MKQRKLQMLYRYNKHSRECNRSETSKFAEKQIGNAYIYSSDLRQIYLADTHTDETRSVLEVGSERLHKLYKNWSSKKERKENALALGADERRGKLRKASGRRKQPSIRRYLNGETYLSKPQGSVCKSIAYGRERCELKHLSSSRRRKKTRFPK